MSAGGGDRPTPDEILARAYALKDADAALALYRDWAATYDATMLDGLGYVTPARTAALLADHLADRAAPVLDVGCGTGLAGNELATLGFSIIDGLDLSAQMLGVARSRGVYRDLFEADLTRPLALADSAYAALVCTGTFTHAHVGASCLPELFRVLAPGGVFACTVHKDVWVEAGFAEMTARLEGEGLIETLYSRPGVYYQRSEEPEGSYIVWRRREKQTT
jgi:predicted TPR repeat methyltransferase